MSDAVGVSLLDGLFSSPVLAWGACTLFYAGFINAFNMADGALPCRALPSA